MTPPPLPILAVLPDLVAALRERASAVLVAPPGAGKTTAVAPALLAEPWCTGEILLLSPRRLAARAAAERMAATAGEPVGQTFGYATRMDSKRSAATRVTVITEGIFVARIQADPELAGVSAVLFDEVHERSLDGDFGLALALDVQAGFRPDLRIVAMSATLDGARFAALMDPDAPGAPVIESEGRSYPLTLRHIGRQAELRIEESVASAIRRALGEAEGGVLAFLPGVAEIERTADRLANLPDDIVLHELHGSLDPAAQRAAILPEPDGRRKVVLATSIAETSLTLDGIRIVVDSGLARRPRYDRAAGMTRLVTERASQAAVTQRAGRAARLGPGIAYRLWEEAATAGLPRYDPPEILEADLSALVLACALWGVGDPRDLRGDVGTDRKRTLRHRIDEPHRVVQPAGLQPHLEPVGEFGERRIDALIAVQAGSLEHTGFQCRRRIGEGRQAISKSLGEQSSHCIKSTRVTSASPSTCKTPSRFVITSVLAKRITRYPCSSSHAVLRASRA